MGEPLGVLSSKTTRGFTGHEEDDDVGLVNAKGRMYDPRLARFTTTDPVIADIWNGQSLIRYSYVEGNPLAFVDPTGFSPEDTAPGWTDTYTASFSTLTDIVVVSSSVVPLSQNHANAAPQREAASVGAYSAPVDVGTTGNGGEGLPHEPTPPEPKKGRFLDGVGAGLGDLVDDFWSFMIQATSANEKVTGNIGNPANGSAR
jgi:RHS repeat-associated protein